METYEVAKTRFFNDKQEEAVEKAQEAYRNRDRDDENAPPLDETKVSIFDEKFVYDTTHTHFGHLVNDHVGEHEAKKFLHNLKKGA